MKSTTHHRDLLILYWMLFDDLGADRETTAEDEQKATSTMHPKKPPTESTAS